MTIIRRRGTAIVETPKGILFASGRHKIFLLPGGGADKGETRKCAAMRELKEETGLIAYNAKYLFSSVSSKSKTFSGKHYYRDYHKVFLIKTKGHAKPKDEVKYLAYWNPKKINFEGIVIDRHLHIRKEKIKLSYHTKRIINRYLKIKNY